MRRRPPPPRRVPPRRIAARVWLTGNGRMRLKYQHPHDRDSVRLSIPDRSAQTRRCVKHLESQSADDWPGSRDAAS